MAEAPATTGRPVGAVLTGGASRRMGRDKATLAIDGVAMAARVAAALRAAGADRVAAVGPGHLAPAGVEIVEDRHPGEGPLAAVLTALDWAGPRPLLVAPCDLLAPDPATLAALVAGLAGGSLAAVPSPADPLPAALAPGARESLTLAFAAGERSLRHGFALLAPTVVALAAEAVADADRPDELPGGSRYAAP